MAKQRLEDIHSIVVHCSATKEGQGVTAKDIDKWHRARGWAGIGYHRVILLDGIVEQGRSSTRRGAHVAGNNTNTLGICLIGGLDKNGKAKDTFTDAQYAALYNEILNIKMFCNIKSIKGHRDYSPDLNGDGIITRNEWIKECPCFQVSEKLEEWGI
jgi:N-acetylmuramoyl-L-alanine amidase